MAPASFFVHLPHCSIGRYQKRGASPRACLVTSHKDYDLPLSLGVPSGPLARCGSIVLYPLLVSHTATTRRSLMLPKPGPVLEGFCQFSLHSPTFDIQNDSFKNISHSHPKQLFDRGAVASARLEAESHRARHPSLGKRTTALGEGTGCKRSQKAPTTNFTIQQR